MNNEDYSDIINLSPPVSDKHKRMSTGDRAAQFAPFAALTGFGSVICESARLTEEQRRLSDEDMRLLNENLRLIQENIKQKPSVEITCFVPDKHKAGGSYITLKARVRRVDETARELELIDKSKIKLDYISSIKIG